MPRRAAETATSEALRWIRQHESEGRGVWAAWRAEPQRAWCGLRSHLASQSVRIRSVHENCPKMAQFRPVLLEFCRGSHVSDKWGRHRGAAQVIQVNDRVRLTEVGIAEPDASFAPRLVPDVLRMRPLFRSARRLCPGVPMAGAAAPTGGIDEIRRIAALIRRRTSHAARLGQWDTVS